MLALTFDVAFASSRTLLHASSLQSGYTAETNRMERPSGDQISPSASVEIEVIFRGSPVKLPVAGSNSCTQTCEPPSRDEINARRLPSGDHRGRSSPACPDVTCRASPPARGMTHRCGVRVLAARFTLTALNATDLPSGDTCGSLTRLSAIMSS